VPQSDEKAIKR